MERECCRVRRGAVAAAGGGGSGRRRPTCAKRQKTHGEVLFGTTFWFRVESCGKYCITIHGIPENCIRL